MEELKLNLENYYGIQKLKEDIDYSNNNVAIVYAPNGTMKSSLAHVILLMNKMFRFLAKRLL